MQLTTDYGQTTVIELLLYQTLLAYILSKRKTKKFYFVGKVKNDEKGNVQFQVQTIYLQIENRQIYLYILLPISDWPANFENKKRT